MTKETIVKSAKVSLLNGKLHQPFSVASGSHAMLENVLISIELADGTKGWGEAAPAPHITGETQERTEYNLRLVADRLLGRDVFDYARLSCEMRDMLAANRCALAAAEMALLDAVTRHLEVPLWKYFGGACETLATDMTVVLGTVDDARKSAEGIAARGIRAFKIKIGKNPDEDFERIMAVAKIARHCPLYLDANEGYSAEQSLDMLPRLKKAGVVPAFFEQPVPRDDWEGLKKVSKAAGVCVGADESVNSIDDCRRVIKEKAAHAINIKLMKFGVFQAHEIARLCKAGGIKIMLGGMLETSLAMHCAAHFGAGIGGIDFVDLDTPFFVKDKVVKGGALSARGIYNMEKIKEGIGVTPAKAGSV